MPFLLAAETSSSVRARLPPVFASLSQDASSEKIRAPESRVGAVGLPSLVSHASGRTSSPRRPFTAPGSPSGRGTALSPRYLTIHSARSVGALGAGAYVSSTSAACLLSVTRHVVCVERMVRVQVPVGVVSVYVRLRFPSPSEPSSLRRAGPLSCCQAPQQ